MGELTTGTATDRETGRTMCYRCADDAQRAGLAALRPGEPFVAYLSGDGRYVTSWSGGKLARVTSHTVSRSGWHGSEIHYIRAVTPEGRRFYGCGGGEGMALTIRASKA